MSATDTGLDHLVYEGVITDVQHRLKSGKEADVYVVTYAGKTVAAKVYKKRAHRNFKNDSGYKEGRTVRNTRSQRAMDRGSKFGQDTAEEAWKSAEVDALYQLHAAGVRVPTPVMYLEGVLLMELVRGADGEPARRLIDIDLTVAEANAAYRDMLTQLVRMLACDLIHGDLSPYNVLWGAAGATIIDFPQIVSAAHNSRSEVFFLRDARNILGHFAGIDETLHGRAGDPAEIWRAYMRRELSPEFVPQGRPRAFAPRPQQHSPQPHSPQQHAPRQMAPQGVSHQGAQHQRPHQQRPPQQQTQQQQQQQQQQQRPPQQHHAQQPHAQHAPQPRQQNQQHQQHQHPRGNRRPPAPMPEVFVRTNRSPSASPNPEVVARPHDDRPPATSTESSPRAEGDGTPARRRRRRRR